MYALDNIFILQLLVRSPIRLIYVQSITCSSHASFFSHIQSCYS